MSRHDTPENAPANSNRPPTWPETEQERVLFADWQYEVGNGDTLSGFRDWVAARAEAEHADHEPLF